MGDGARPFDKLDGFRLEGWNDEGPAGPGMGPGLDQEGGWSCIRHSWT